MKRARYCGLYLACDEQWYMDLAEEEGQTVNEAFTYGPFKTEAGATKYLHDNFADPGLYHVDESGQKRVPRRSPNGHEVICPSYRKRQG